MQTLGGAFVRWGAGAALVVLIAAVSGYLWLESSGHGDPGVGIGVVFLTAIALFICVLVIAIGGAIMFLSHAKKESST